MRVEAKLQELGLVLPAPAQIPPGYMLPFAWARVSGQRVFLSGHAPQAPDGSFTGPFGQVPTDVSLDAAQAAARTTALALLASLQRAIGDLDRVSAWLIVHGMVNAAPGYPQTTQVINGFSQLILELYGPTVGQHARTAVGMAALPLNNVVTIAAEIEITR